MAIGIVALQPGLDMYHELLSTFFTEAGMADSSQPHTLEIIGPNKLKVVRCRSCIGEERFKTMDMVTFSRVTVEIVTYFGFKARTGLTVEAKNQVLNVSKFLRSLDTPGVEAYMDGVPRFRISKTGSWLDI